MIRRKLLYPLVAIAIAVPAAVLVGKDPEQAPAAAKEMLEVAREGYALQLESLHTGQARDPDHAWSERILKAELLVTKTGDQRREATQRHLERTKQILEVETKRYESGVVVKLAVLEAQYRVAEAKQLLADN
jgi:hypothetical protein